DIFVDRPPRKAKEAPVCVCMPPADGGLGCLEDCLNRCMFIECDVKTCPCGSQCSNQAFQRRDEVKELEVHWTQARGYGLRTNVDIPKGTLVHEYRGEVISQQTCLDRMSTIYKDQTCCYFLNYANGEVIDACQKGTVARFVNHSCDPNCHIEKWFINGEFGVGLFSSVDIPKGTELTYDYRFDAFGPMQKCFCGATKCRGKNMGLQ
ncbi:structural basis of auto-inhibitory mechanism of histone methyltransferase, partial [Polychytrium aggregatum]|uniref:structural basis of auto-inhibitory mechanism of histone methyltransferase n=1 Tax=Polychytrium aggregatum TaxID=110093 RepID=UPI0022FDECC2